jgi:hypothetical protein
MFETMNAVQVSFSSIITGPIRATTSGPAALRQAFERAGWRSVDALESLPDGVSYGVLATREAESAGSATTALVFGYEGAREVRLADLWRLLAEMNSIRPDAAAICLGDGSTISQQAAETAALLDLSVFRIAA